MTLDPSVRTFLGSGLHHATLATLDPDGAPRQVVIWFALEGDEVVVNSLVGRRWPSNLLRDPRVSFSVAEADGSHWIGIVGIATPVTDQAAAQADIAGMARRYHADDPAVVASMVARFEGQERISFRIRALTVRDHLE